MQRFLPFVLLILLLPLAACSGAPKTVAEIKAAEDGRGLVGVGLDGKSHDLDREFAQGKFVTLVFWQDWCDSCLSEAPRIQAASQTYANRIAFFGVVSGIDQTENDSDLRNCVRELGVTYPQIRDRDCSWSIRFEIASTPTVLVFSPNGTLRYRGRHLPGSWDDFLEE